MECHSDSSKILEKTIDKILLSAELTLKPCSLAKNFIRGLISCDILQLIEKSSFLVQSLAILFVKKKKESKLVERTRRGVSPLAVGLNIQVQAAVMTVF